jgi:hypothetical protein
MADQNVPMNRLLVAATIAVVGLSPLALTYHRQPRK